MMNDDIYININDEWNINENKWYNATNDKWFPYDDSVMFIWMINVRKDAFTYVRTYYSSIVRPNDILTFSEGKGKKNS